MKIYLVIFAGKVKTNEKNKYTKIYNKNIMNILSWFVSVLFFQLI